MITIDLAIRPATTADVDELSALIQLSVRLLNAPDYEPRIIALICANFTPANVLAKMGERDVFASTIADRIVGTISLGGCKLHSLFVDPDLKGGGIGSRLVAHLERHARTKGLHEIALSSSLTAHPFYQKLGYDDVAFEERADGSTYLMRKRI